MIFNNTESVGGLYLVANDNDLAIRI